MTLTIELLLLLFLVAAVAGFVDSISGGGGLISIPALMLAGMSPVQALATNKLQAIFGKISSVRYFSKHGLINFTRYRWAIGVTFVASGAGALLIQRLPNDLLSAFVPWLIGVVACYVLFSPKLGDVDKSQRISVVLFSVMIVPLLAFYDGFFGPASGSFFALSFIVLLGYNAAKATAHAKLLLLVSNGAALIAFIAGGEVIWSVGLCMALGQWIGARYGSQLVHLKGSRLVKPMLITVCFLMLGKMLFN